jgi:hypothetical protein
MLVSKAAPLGRLPGSHLQCCIVAVYIGTLGLDRERVAEWLEALDAEDEIRSLFRWFWKRPGRGVISSVRLVVQAHSGSRCRFDDDCHSPWEI